MNKDVRKLPLWAQQMIVLEKETQRERIYLECLSIVIQHCHGWEIGKKPINNAEGYCQLAESFTKASIKPGRAI